MSDERTKSVICGYIDNVEPPERLGEVIERAIADGRVRRSRRRTASLAALSTAAALFLVFVTALNASPTFARTLDDIPIIGEVCRVFTFRDYHFSDEVKVINVRAPQLDAGGTPTEQRINEEIAEVIDGTVEEYTQLASEFYDDYLASGGEPEAFPAADLLIDYEIKHEDERLVSFVVDVCWVIGGSSETRYYYNIDLAGDRRLTLKDALGEDYRSLALDAVSALLEAMDEDERGMLAEDLDLSGLIDEDTAFYYDKNGRVVVAFERGELGASALGILEFPID